MHSGLDQAFVEECGKVVATRTANRKQMVYGFGVGRERGHAQWHSCQPRAVAVCPITPAGVPVVQKTQFVVENCPLQCIHSVIKAYLCMLVLRKPTVVAQSAEPGCQVGVVSGNRAGITKCAQVFPRIKAETGGGTEAADAAPIKICAMRLSGIFNQNDPFIVTNLFQFTHAQRLAVKVYGDHSTTMGTNGVGKRVQVHLPSRFVCINKNRACTGEINRRSRGYERVRGDDYFVARSNPRSEQYQMQGSGPGINSNCFFDPAIGRKSTFELCDGSAFNVASGSQKGPDSVL